MNLLIDGNNLLHRAFHARGDGTRGAIEGFQSMIVKLTRGYSGAAITVGWDGPGDLVRRQWYPAYKPPRSGPGHDAVCEATVPVRMFISQIGGVNVDDPGWEADDVLADLAGSATGVTLIVSGDRDLLQLVDDTRQIGVLDSAHIVWDEDLVTMRYDLSPRQLPDLKALMGDAGDNIPGVPKVGVKTATQLLRSWDTLERVLEAAALGQVKPVGLGTRLTQHADLARLSYRLGKLGEKK